MSPIEGRRNTSVQIFPESMRSHPAHAVTTTRSESTTTSYGDHDDIYIQLVGKEAIEEAVSLSLAGAGLGIMALGIKDLALGLKHKDVKKALLGAGKITTALLVMGGIEAQLEKRDETSDALDAFKTAETSPRLTGRVTTLLPKP